MRMIVKVELEVKLEGWRSNLDLKQASAVLNFL